MSSPLRILLARFGFEFEAAAAERAESLIDRVTGAAARFGNMLLAGATATGIASFIQSQIDTGGELEEVAGRLRISATELRTWRLAAEEAGASSESVERAIGRVGLVAARTPAAIRGLGVETRTSNGELRRASDIFADVGIALNAIENDTDRAARATAIFGRSGTEVLRVFEGGAEGIAHYRDLVRRLYGTDLDQLAQLSDRAGDAQAEFNLALDAVSTRLAVAFLPAVTRGIEAGVELVSTFAEWVRNSRFAEASLVTLGAVAVAIALATIEAWGPPLVVFGLIAAAIAGVVLVLDDLMVAADGGNSVIARYVDGLLGVGATQGALRGVVRFFEDVAAVAAAAWEAARPLVEWLGGFASGASATIGADIRSGVVGARDVLAASPDIGSATTGDVVSGLVGLAAPFLPGGLGGAATSLVSGARSLVRNVTTGPIIVNDTSGNSRETAREVVGELERRAADDDEADAADLIPVGGGA